MKAFMQIALAAVLVAIVVLSWMISPALGVVALMACTVVEVLVSMRITDPDYYTSNNWGEL